MQISSTSSSRVANLASSHAELVYLITQDKIQILEKMPMQKANSPQIISYLTNKIHILILILARL